MGSNELGYSDGIGWTGYGGRIRVLPFGGMEWSSLFGSSEAV